MDPFSILGGLAGGSFGNAGPADAGSYAPNVSGATTGNFYLGQGAGTSGGQLPIELIAIAGLFLWLMISKR